MSYRLIIIGCSCAGKTTLGARLGRELGLKHIDLDDLHWLPNWQPETIENLRDKISEAIEGVDNWVITGAYSRTWDITMPRATHVVFIDLPFYVILYRFFTRTYRRLVKKEKCCGENFERWGAVFSKDSLLLWILKTYGRKREQFKELVKNPVHKDLKFLHLKSTKDVQNITDML